MMEMIRFEVNLLDKTYRGTVNSNSKGQKIMGSIKLENEIVDKETYGKIVRLLSSNQHV